MRIPVISYIENCIRKSINRKIQKVIDFSEKRKIKHTIIPAFKRSILGDLIKQSIKAKVEKLKANIDEKSGKIIDDSVEKIIESLTINENMEKFVTCEQKADKSNFNNEISSIKEKYKLPADVYLPEVFYYHHGLKFLPDKIKNYLEAKDFLDCGAYIGDSTLVLREYSPNKIYSFEFSQENIELFKRTMILNNFSEGEYELIPAIVSNRNTELLIKDYGGGAASVNKEFFNDFIGDESCPKVEYVERKVNSISIDKFVEKNNLNVGLIKADVEGALLEVIQGAVNTIRVHRPVMTLGIYHNTTEFFEVKPYLEEILDNYIFEFKIMNFSPLFLSELTLIAYPKNL